MALGAPCLTFADLSRIEQKLETDTLTNKEKEEITNGHLKQQVVRMSYDLASSGTYVDACDVCNPHSHPMAPRVVESCPTVIPKQSKVARRGRGGYDTTGVPKHNPDQGKNYDRR